MLPDETISAVFPPIARLRGIRYRFGIFPVAEAVLLKPLTLLGATAIEALGVDLADDEMSHANALICAWVMTLSASDVRQVMADERFSRESFAAFNRRVRENAGTLRDVVNSHIKLAFSTCVPGEQANKPNLLARGPTGYGWPLEVAELLASEHGVPLADALDTPLVTALAVLACARIRNGGKAGGPDYYERIVCREIRKRKMMAKDKAEAEEKDKTDGK